MWYFLWLNSKCEYLFILFGCYLVKYMSPAISTLLKPAIYLVHKELMNAVPHSGAILSHQFDERETKRFEIFIFLCK